MWNSSFKVVTIFVCLLQDFSRSDFYLLTLSHCTAQTESTGSTLNFIKGRPLFFSLFFHKSKLWHFHTVKGFAHFWVSCVLICKQHSPGGEDMTHLLVLGHLFYQKLLLCLRYCSGWLVTWLILGLPTTGGRKQNKTKKPFVWLRQPEHISFYQ